LVNRRASTKGTKNLTSGDLVSSNDLEPFASLVHPGDAVVIRTGRYAVKAILPGEEVSEDDHVNWSGLYFINGAPNMAARMRH